VGATVPPHAAVGGWGQKEVTHSMVRSESIDDIVVSLDVRRAQLRRRRRRDAMREWAGLAALTTVGLWLAIVALLTLLAH